MPNKLLLLLLLSLPLPLLAIAAERPTLSLKCQLQWAQKDGKRVSVQAGEPIRMEKTGNQLRVGDVRYFQTLTRANHRYFSSQDRLLHACVIDEGRGQRKVILRISGTATTMVMDCRTPLIAASNP